MRTIVCTQERGDSVSNIWRVQKPFATSYVFSFLSSLTNIWKLLDNFVSCYGKQLVVLRATDALIHISESPFIPTVEPGNKAKIYDNHERNMVTFKKAIDV